MPVRRALAAILALPVLAAIYLPLALRRGPATRIALSLGMGGIVLAAAVGVPAGTVGAPQTTPTPLTASALGPAVATSRTLSSAMIVDFAAPMDQASVADAVRVEPAAPVRLSWSEDGTRLSVEPAAVWKPATYYTVTVGTGARDADGNALASPLRAAFMTRAATTARLAVADQGKSGVGLDSSLVIAFDRPVPIDAVVRAFRIAPATPGQLLIATDGPDSSDLEVADSFVWEPNELLAADTSYSVDLAGLVDDEGAAVEAAGLTFRTVETPSVVRFRPRAGTTEKVKRGATVSVRFTMPMDRKTTKRAFSVEVNGKAVAGTVTFVENDTVLVFDPAKDFPYKADVTAHVAMSALAKNGTALDRPRAAAFEVVAKPKPKPKPAATSSSSGSRGTTPKPKPTVKPTPTTRPTSSSWLAAEKYLLTLMNRERTKRGVPALSYHAGVSDHVARPYAKKLVAANVCSHFYGGTAGDRLRAAGYTSYHWAENLGCRYFSDPRDAAESLVRFFLGSPGHFTNMVNREYTHAGIGLWIAGGRLRFVAVFYTP